MVYVYILKLLNDKYYIGKSDNPEIRIENHMALNGSSWTKLYKPINVIEIIPNCDDYDEDKYTLKYMEKYGVENVRGGSFCEVNLSKENITTINKMLNGSNNRCYKCNKSGHFIKECPLNKLYCDRCKRSNHNTDECYATTYINGDKIDECIIL